MKVYLNKLDHLLSQYLVKQAPPLPSNWKKFLTQAAPWFAVLSFVLGLPSLLAVFGFGALATPFAVLGQVRTLPYWFFFAIALVQVVFSGLAIKPLFAREGHGWRLMFYSQLLSLLTSLRYLSVVSLALAIVSLYLLYQIKSSYKH